MNKLIERFNSFNRKKFTKAEDMGWALRVFVRNSYKDKGKKYRRKIDPHIEVKCGCCDESLVIIGGGMDDVHGNLYLEINGVAGSVEEWRKILLPILKIKSYEIHK